MGAAAPAVVEEKSKVQEGEDTNEERKTGTGSILENEISRFVRLGLYEADPNFVFPQTIHDSKAIKFFTSIIARDNYVEDILVNKLRIPLKEPVFKYQESNNNSAKDNMQELRKIIREWIKEVKVIQLTEKPNIINPMSVIIQKKIDGTVKIRPVIDCSRYINSKFSFGSVKLDDLREVEKLIQAQDFFCSIDFFFILFIINYTMFSSKYSGFLSLLSS